MVDSIKMCTSLPSPESLILVAVMTHPRDLEIARVLGWYRIPLRSAPRVISVDYLAFYQTAAFGETRWQVKYLAKVNGHELTTRQELIRDEPDHPHAQQEYFKIQIGSLIKLPEPIYAKKWRRISFFYTTGELMLKARGIHDLIVPAEERSILWQALRERAAQSEKYQIDPPTNMDIDECLLANLLGISDIGMDYAIDTPEKNEMLD